MNKIICIDAGHGGKDPGACGNGVKEKELVLKVAKAVGAGLVEQGIEVIYTRIADNYVNLGERCRIANTQKVALFVSIHANSAQNATANGIETLCYTKNSLAEITQKELVSALKLKDRGIKERRDLYVLNGTEMPAILVELGFLSNVNDANVMRKNGFENIAANAIVSGICKYLGVEKRRIWKWLKVLLWVLVELTRKLKEF